MPSQSKSKGPPIARLSNFARPSKCCYAVCSRRQRSPCRPSFIITATKMELPADGDTDQQGTNPVKLSDDGSGFVLTDKGEEAKEKFERAKGWFEQMSALGKGISSTTKGRKGTNKDELLQAGASIESSIRSGVTDYIAKMFEGKSMWLYLIDEYTGEPIIPAEGSVYPIEITKPSETTVKLLPIMRTGLKVMSTVNGVALVGNMLGFPIPHVPEEWRKKANAAVGGLDKASSVAEFDTLQKSLDRSGENADGEDKTEELRGYALREFMAFIEEKDRKHDFSGMGRLVTPEGKACWTQKTSEELAKEERLRIAQVSSPIFLLDYCR